MMQDDVFEKIVEEAVEKIPEPYKSRIDNIAFIIEDFPSDVQRRNLGLRDNETLFGLYEGVPLPKRGGAMKLLPDKITIFKGPILARYTELDSIKKQVAKTIWHEVAHYFGLDHERIHEIENKHIK